MKITKTFTVTFDVPDNTTKPLFVHIYAKHGKRSGWSTNYMIQMDTLAKENTVTQLEFDFNNKENDDDT